MKKKSLSTRILNYLKAQYPNKIAGGKIEDLAKSVGYSGSTATRCCRKLTEQGLLKVSHGKKNHSYYRAVVNKVTEYKTPDGVIVKVDYK